MSDKKATKQEYLVKIFCIEMKPNGKAEIFECISLDKHNDFLKNNKYHCLFIDLGLGLLALLDLQ